MLTQTPIRNESFKQSATQLHRAPPAGAAMQVGTIELMGACMSFSQVASAPCPSSTRRVSFLAS
jgi:hypothetical protein